MGILPKMQYPDGWESSDGVWPPISRCCDDVEEAVNDVERKPDSILCRKRLDYTMMLLEHEISRRMRLLDD
jgi:hypothetical protein